MNDLFPMSDACGLLSCLGVTANYRGFFQTAYAVQLCVEDPERLQQLTNRLYPEVARQYNTNWRAIERNIRTVSIVIWRKNRTLLEQLACGPLFERPTPTQLLAILSTSLLLAQKSPPRT
jgi:two-component system response regulator (stage 0 sporulation protein A)